MDIDFKLPGLGRPESSRPMRVAEAIKNELSLLLLQRVADPRLHAAAISKVWVSPDIKQAKIYFTVRPPAVVSNTAKALNKAKGFFRTQLAHSLDLRHTPELFFYHDNLQEEAERVQQLLDEIAQEKDHDEQS